MFIKIFILLVLVALALLIIPPLIVVGNLGAALIVLVCLGLFAFVVSYS